MGKKHRKVSYDIVYDGSFEGFLTSIFNIYKHKYDDVKFHKAASYSHNMFNEEIRIETKKSEYTRVAKGIVQRATKRIGNEVYKLFLSRTSAVDLELFSFIKSIFNSDFNNHRSDILKSTRTKMNLEIDRQKSNMAFIELYNDIHLFIIKPDQDILPFIINYMISKHASKELLLFDTIRGYGYHHSRYVSQYITAQYDLFKSPDLRVMNHSSNQNIDFKQILNHQNTPITNHPFLPKTPWNTFFSTAS